MLYLNETIVCNDDYTGTLDEGFEVYLYLQLCMYAHIKFDSCYGYILYF